MRSIIVRTGLLILLIAGVHNAAVGQQGVFIYQGAPLSQAGITLGSWGSGKAVESREQVLTGGQSIKITTQGLYSGGRIDFSQPVTLFSDGIDPKKYIVFSLFFTEIQEVDPAAGSGYWYDIEPYKTPKATRVRFTFFSDTGLSVSAEVPTRPLDRDDNWVRLAVPLAKFKLPEDVRAFRLKRLVIATDAPGTLTTPATVYLGEARIVEDDTPIKIDPLGTQSVVIGDQVFFAANASAGVSSLKYSWDWDNRNGIQEESTGFIGRVTYYKGGEYVVTLIVSDIDGIKMPASVTTTVSVSE